MRTAAVWGATGACGQGAQACRGAAAQAGWLKADDAVACRVWPSWPAGGWVVNGWVVAGGLSRMLDSSGAV